MRLFPIWLLGEGGRGGGGIWTGFPICWRWGRGGIWAGFPTCGEEQIDMVYCFLLTVSSDISHTETSDKKFAYIC